ncbi:MAG: hypothetical protein AAF799_39325 [Myxococcota bacterium]
MSGRSAVRRHLTDPRLRRRWLTGLVVTPMTLLPLVGTLGYFSGFLLSPLAAALGLCVGVDGVRAWRQRESPGDSPVRSLVAAGAIELGWLVAIAVGILLLAQLWQRNCDPWGGLAFFAMGPLLSAVMGWVAGLFGGSLGQRRWAQILLGGLIPAASTGIGLWRLWADPVVFAFDPFWGYFSGAIYDEAVAIGSTYLTFRAYNVLAAAAGLGLWRVLADPATLRLRNPGSWKTTLPAATPVVIAGGLAMWIGMRGAAMGFTANIESITQVLSGVRETEHFIIHYNPRSHTARRIDMVAADHELAWHQLEEAMGRAPEGKVRSFVFANPNQKRALMGAGTVQVAAPWRQQIYLDNRGWPHPVLPHELAHIFGNTIGDSVFGVSLDGVVPNVALIEGFATAMAPRAADRLDLHDQATVLERLGKRPPMAAIMGPAFFTRSSRVAYTTAGSFSRWLIDTRGFEPMATLYYNGGDFQAAYGESLGALEERWLAFINEREGVTDDDVQAQAQRYRRSSVFQRPCAHRAATLLQKVGRDQSRGRFDEAIEGYRTLCSLEPERPEHKLGLSQALAIAQQFEEALSSLDEAMAVEDLTVTLRARVLEQRADVALAAGELEVAAASLDEAMLLPVSTGQRRGLRLKLAAAADPDLAPLIVEYYLMFDTQADSATGAVRRLYAAQQIRERPGYEALGSYLLGLQLLNAERPAAARPLLEDAVAQANTGKGLPGPEFLRNARLKLTNVCTQTGRFDQADALLDVLEAEPGIGNGHRLIYGQWRARVAFFREYLGRE